MPAMGSISYPAQPNRDAGCGTRTDSGPLVIITRWLVSEYRDRDGLGVRSAVIVET